MGKRAIIKEGDRFGKLTIIKEVKPHITPCGTKQRKFLCKCDCGKSVVKRLLDLKVCRSCGCDVPTIGDRTRKYSKEATCSFLYSTWKGMKQRCYDENSSSYQYYGERGISICDEWLYDYMSFYRWAIANGASEELTIDRIDYNGNYEPSNCRWVNLIVQANNKTSNRVIEYNGESHTVMEWSRITGIKEATIRSRIDNYGCTVGQALGYEEYDVHFHYIEYNGERHTIAEWSRITGVKAELIRTRIAVYGFTPEEALGYKEHDYIAKPKKLTYNGETHNLTEWGRILNMSRKTIKDRLDRGCTAAQALGFETIVKRKPIIQTKHVIEYDLYGSFVKEWESAAEAANHYGVSQTSIRYACNGVVNTSCNRIWKYKN